MARQVLPIVMTDYWSVLQRTKPIDRIHLIVGESGKFMEVFLELPLLRKSR